MKKIALVALLLAVGLGATSCCRACRAVKSKPVAGTQWALQELNDKVVDRQSSDRTDRFTLTLGEDGRVSGRGDCNTFFAGYSLTDGKIAINNIASTRMMCPNQTLEDQYFRMLESAATADVDGEYMILRNGEGKIVASFRSVSK